MGVQVFMTVVATGQQNTEVGDCVPVKRLIPWTLLVFVMDTTTKLQLSYFVELTESEDRRVPDFYPLSYSRIAVTLGRNLAGPLKPSS